MADCSYGWIEDHSTDASARYLRRPAAPSCCLLATYLGIPVSTTHTVTGSVIGVGAARKVSAVGGTLLPISSLRGSLRCQLRH